ncbi:MAG: trehalose-6-phosphate synthase, partial [Ktedonobacterales bacterium]|nr:trehalose-6-phosphate synthase [Ktedonobacterales bacterium]
MPGDGHSLLERAEVTDMAGRWGGAAERERLILVSNRGPVEYTFTDDGLPEAHRGAGGVVSGLLCAVRQRPVTWISLAMTEADRLVAQTRAQVTPPPAMDLRGTTLTLVDIPCAAYSRHYNDISNRVLWFAQHYLLNPTQTGTFSQKTAADWEKGYTVANTALAEVVIATLRAEGMNTPVLFQDYHCDLAPALVRAACPEARLAHFVHIPWPEPRYWEMLPEYTDKDIHDVTAY